MSKSIQSAGTKAENSNVAEATTSRHAIANALLAAVLSEFEGSLLTFRFVDYMDYKNLVAIESQLIPNEFLEENTSVSYKDAYFDKIRKAMASVGFEDVSFNNTGHVFWVVVK